ncbi:hypothetical protein CERZMDRAFT_90140 [Cercospora zeae-maydis SCOH1-5]|uniref:Uncharacterized protein n=1 Tax=Cercospora zeae-maydis SCOH1-5 TaxID=717836 RepID=A0A6A6FPS7_9PEZI|nr:hypothetical protein CERZMDRAFT_90140 [Cercospora zeae-maydis SCOH1-5]
MACIAPPICLKAVNNRFDVVGHVSAPQRSRPSCFEQAQGSAACLASVAPRLLRERRIGNALQSVYSNQEGELIGACELRRSVPN